MASIPGIIFYILVFMSVYVQVFFLVTFLENRKKIVCRKGVIKLNEYPAVTVIVPCWNEQNTISDTVKSLFSLNYPKDKLNIFLVDDGSTDNTWNIISKFADDKNVKVFRKENGGKYTALNLGLEKSETDFFACLDADSFADPESLIRLMSYFEKDPSIMAVAPSIVAINPKRIIQKAQKAEYFMGIYMKKMLGFLDAINVTPGPLTVFRKKVFNDLGPYRHAHNTEDMEIAYRMQKNHYKIAHCNDAFVYTNTPGTVRKLYKQRLRWIYGFINNTIDYKDVLFRKEYGNFATFTLPTGVLSILSVGYLFWKIVFSVGNFLYEKYTHFQAVGFDFHWGGIPTFDPFFINIKMSLFLIMMIYAIIFFAILFGEKMYEGKWKFSLELFYFFPIFIVIAPFWVIKAMWNTLISKAPAWR